MKRGRKIERPWCVYVFGLFPGGVGKVEREADTCAYVKYAEGQMYPLAPWDKGHLWRFKTIAGAIRRYHRHIDKPLDVVRKSVMAHFPSEFQNK